MMKGKLNAPWALLVLAVVITAAAVAGVQKCRRSGEGKQQMSVADHTGVSVKLLSELVTTEFEKEIPVADSIGSRHLFGRMRVEGAIKVNLNDVDPAKLDSVRPEDLTMEVEMRESTREDSWEVIKRWNTRMFGSATFSNSEVNVIKRRAAQKAVRKLKEDGTVDSARAEAARTLRRLAAAVGGSRPADGD